LGDQPQEAKHLQELATILYCRMEKKQERRRHVDTRNDAKCSEVITALKPTTGTNAARSVPSITCKMIHGSGKLQFWTTTLERRVCQPKEALCTHKGSICNVEPRRITTSYNAQEDMHWDKIDNECVASPRADLEKPSL
jgi:hypothetical protein